jgi:hypothetical protein
MEHLLSSTSPSSTVTCNADGMDELIKLNMVKLSMCLIKLHTTPTFFTLAMDGDERPASHCCFPPQINSTSRTV